MSLETYWMAAPLVLLGLSGIGWLWLWRTPRQPSVDATARRDLPVR